MTHVFRVTRQKRIEERKIKCFSYISEHRSWRGVLDTTLCDKVC